VVERNDTMREADGLRGQRKRRVNENVVASSGGRKGGDEKALQANTPKHVSVDKRETQ